MPESKNKWRLSEKAYVRFDAAQAAFCAAASSLVPVPLGVAMDVADIDPVAWKQRQMLGRLGIDAAVGGATRTQAHRSANKSRHERQMAMRGGQTLARGATLVLKRSGKAAVAGAVRRSIPLIGAAIAFVVAYRQTAAMGLAIVDSQQGSKRTRLKGKKHD